MTTTTPKVTIRKAYTGRERTPLDFGDEVSRTEQHHKESVSVQNILKQYDKTGIVNHVARAKAEYGDFTEVNEYQESLNRIIHANNAFEALPSGVRKKFNNDAGEFFEFATNPENLGELRELGLAKPAPQEAQPTKVEVVNTTESSA